MATADELRARWADLESGWSEAVARAEALGAVDERVDGEWSFAETLRHLVFATDAWIRRPMLRVPSPFWTAALPHTECPDAELVGSSIDRVASPSWHDVVTARADRQRIVRELLAGLDDTGLSRRCEPGAPPPDLGADSDTLTAADCLETVVEEETAHLGYAERDLAVLEGRRLG